MKTWCMMALLIGHMSSFAQIVAKEEKNSTMQFGIDFNAGPTFNNHDFYNSELFTSQTISKTGVYFYSSVGLYFRYNRVVAEVENAQSVYKTDYTDSSKVEINNNELLFTLGYAFGKKRLTLVPIVGIGLQNARIFQLQALQNASNPSILIQSLSLTNSIGLTYINGYIGLKLNCLLVKRSQEFGKIDFLPNIYFGLSIRYGQNLNDPTWEDAFGKTILSTSRTKLKYIYTGISLTIDILHAE